MEQYKAQDNPRTHPCLLNFASLRVIATACFIMHAAGCAHQTAGRTPVPQKSPAMEKQAAPGAIQPSRLEQPDKARTVERKSKEKKPTASTDKIPDKKEEQPEEISSDTLIPPPPLKPPTFGGAGG